MKLVSKRTSLQMECALISFYFVTICLSSIYSSSVLEEYDQRPKIITRDGDLIFTSANERNIRFISSNGGSIFLNNDDLLLLVNTVREAATTINSIREGLLNDISNRISNLEELVSGNQGLTNRLAVMEQNIANGSSSIDMPGNVDTKLKTLFSKVMRLTQIVGKIRTSLNTNECSSNPCRNGGTCEDSYNGFICRCPPNWEGTLCEADVNECAHFAGTDLGCQNGATCINRIGSYECRCASGFYGLHCTRRDKECSKNNPQDLCGHGICINQEGTSDGYTCLCDQGWTKGVNSKACTEDIDECRTGRPVCSKNPPVMCINLPGTFHCGPCPQGYTGNGFYCVDIDECQINNGGCSLNPSVQCTNTQGSRICGPCPPGYQGDGTICNFVGVCRVNNGGCHPLARCVDNPAISQSYVQCICPTGFIGSGIGPAGCMSALPGTDTSVTNACQPNPCIHGTCQVAGNTFICLCFDGFSGTTCNMQRDPCLSNPCQNGGSCVGLRTGYYCRCPQQTTGMHCEEQQMTCGGRLNSEAGVLKFPPSNTRTNYPASMSCGWQILTNQTQVLNVTFNSFNLEESPECTYDWIQIYDGPSSAFQAVGRYCGTRIPPNIVSTHNSLYVWFRSDHSNQREGFELSWTSIEPVCGGSVIFQSHGSLSSPGYPGKYPINRNCVWQLKAPYGKRINIHFYTMNIENHSNCSYDFVEIRNGFNNQILKKFCNTSLPEPITTPSNRANIRFHSDNIGRDTGFQISYSVTRGSECGGIITRASGTITPPIDPETKKYKHQITCEWVIHFPEEQRIQIQFLKMALENHARCAYDKVEIHEGQGPTSSLVGRYCGNQLPRPYTSYGNILTIIFSTDSSYAFDGFIIKYKEVCGGLYTGTTGHITSPMYPNVYLANKDCVYEIRQPPGTSITLNFFTFILENRSRFSELCYDYIEIRDGHNEKAPLLGKYCGTQFPPTTISTHNYLWIKFHTDSSHQYQGFFANFTTEDISCGGIIRESAAIIQTPQYPYLYPNNHVCRWIIVADEGNVINLNWVSFHLEESNMFAENCVYDFVEVYENITEGAEGVKIGNRRYCGNVSPPNMTSTSNILTIIFKTDSSMAYPGFTARLSQIQASNVCSANFVSSMGTILSPGYPSPYPHNKDCTWIITVPTGQQILLNVSNFRLESHYNCDWDYLEIRNGGYSTSPLIGKFCGREIQSPIPSISNQMYLRFVTDHSRSALGFNITWDGTIAGCGGMLSGKSGHIISPNYPQQYGVDTECFYRISTSQGSKIQIVFLDFDLEQTRGCFYDYLAFYDGTDSSGRLIGRYCSENHPHAVLSKTNNMFIKFKSDSSHFGRGFSIKYDTVCDVTLSGFGGVIESPNFPNQYPNQLYCKWTIQVRRGNFINITFSHFMLESQCDDDYVRIREAIGEHVELTPLRSDLCGPNIPSPINSNSNKVVIEMKTDERIRFSGFRLEWFLHGCGGHFTDSQGEIKSPNYPNGYKDNTECEWLISVELGKSIELTIEDFDVEASGNCQFDMLTVYGGPDETSPKLANGLCHAIQKPMKLTSSGNNMFITFTSDSSFTGRGFKMTYKTTNSSCGGIFITPSGNIHSHNYPGNYEAFDDCLWLIQVDENHVVELNFLTFDLETHENCSYDYVKLFDGNSTDNPEIATLCGNSLPNITTYTSTGNTMLVRMKADGSSSYPGFLANYSTVCGARIVTESFGIISLSSAINANRRNHNCSWIIIGSQPQDHITLTITHLDVSPNSENGADTCQDSYLEVFDGEDESSNRLGPYCGSRIPPQITSHGSALRLHLVSSYGYHYGYFSASYSVIQGVCGGNLTSELGSFSSPGYPDTYGINTECVWTISASPGNRVSIGFRSFSLEQSDNCDKDYLEIRESISEGNLIGVYCSDIPSSINASQSLWIKFHSDGEGTAEGFIADYTLVHGNELFGTSGQIASPLYPRPYIQVGLFSWRITVNVGSAIRITFKEFYIDSLTDGCSMYLAFYDGFDETAPEIAKKCGTLVPDPITSSSNILYIVMNTYHRGSIFLLEWMQIERVPVPRSTAVTSQDCGGMIFLTNDVSNSSSSNSSDEYILTSPGYPNGYRSRLNCEWIIQTSPLHHVVLAITDMDLETTRKCTADYLSVYQGEEGSNNWKLQKTLCHSNSSAEIPVEATNLMKVVFKTDYSVNKTGFSARVYPACGGSIQASSGVIEVDNTTTGVFQRNYYLECRWNITVKPGRTIKVIFNRFYIRPEGPNSCSYRFLKLQNGHFQDSPALGQAKYCGSSLPVVPDTTSNHLSITYKNMRGGRGFKLKFFEVSESCGGTFSLNRYNSYMEISSPKFPLPPPPHTECLWSFLAPGGETLQVDFDATFDFQYTEGCEKDYVEVRDGGTSLSRVINRFCRTAPGTQRTTRNMVWIHFFTDTDSHQARFKANVSLARCGGVIRHWNGQIRSPSFPREYPSNTQCSWRIEIHQYNSISIQFRELDLPIATDCATTDHVSISEVRPYLRTNNVIQTVCGRELPSLVEVASNTALVEFTSLGPQQYHYAGFHLNFTTSYRICGGEMRTPSGEIKTPGFPNRMQFLNCAWQVIVPKGRRVTINIQTIDMDFTERHSSDLLFYNQQHPYFIDSLWRNRTLRRVQSSGNIMHIYLYSWSNHLGRVFMQYSSDEPAECGGDLQGTTGSLDIPQYSTQSFYCEWEYIPPPEINGTLAITFQNITIGRYGPFYNCMYSGSKLRITGADDNEIIFEYCGNNSQSIVALSPFPATKINIGQNIRSGIVTLSAQYSVSSCGGILSGPDEIITSPEYPTQYPANIHCAWNVKFPDDKRISVHFDAFQLEEQCTNDYIIIHNGPLPTSPMIGRFCGSNIPKDIISQSNTLWIEFHSNSESEFSGFKMTLSTVSSSCGGILHGSNSIISTPNFPQQYPNNAECEWEIRAENGYYVQLKFIQRFQLEQSIDCSNDFVEIFDYIDNDYVLLHKLCGRNMPPLVNSTSSQLRIRFKSNENTQGDGFKAQWTQKCGGLIENTTMGHIISPGYPNQYSNRLNCNYTVRMPGQFIRVEFDRFELEGSDSCKFDNVTIYRFERWQSQVQLGPYCGKNKPQSFISGDGFSLIFQTDNSVTNPGFILRFWSLTTCGGTVNEPGRITAPDVFMFNYYVEVNCTWTIYAPQDKVIVVRFSTLVLPSLPCFYSSYGITIFDGPYADVKYKVAKYCGNLTRTLPAYQSSGNKLVFQYITSSYTRNNYFDVDILFTYGERSGCGGKKSLTLREENIQSPDVNNDGIYEPSLDCHWSLSTQGNQVISLDMTNFQVKPCINATENATNYCGCDYVEIRDGENQFGELIGIYCGNRRPGPITSSGNNLWIRFVTDGETGDRGFVTKVRAQPSLCSTPYINVTSSLNSLTSYNYPNGYPPNLRCNWLLTGANPYDKIAIHIEDLNITSSNDCSTSMLQITDLSVGNIITQGTGQNVAIIGQPSTPLAINYISGQPITPYIFCGEVKDFIYYSVTGSVSISFVASEISSKGFNLTYSKTGCNRNYTSPQGRIHVYGMQENNCIILIETSPNRTISLYFSALHTSNNCENTNFEIRDGTTPHAPLLATVCGNSIANPVFSTGNSVRLQTRNVGEMDSIHFNMDITYTTTDQGRGCGGKIFNYGGIFTSPMYPANIRNTSVCRWDVTVPTGNLATLKFKVFEIGPSSSCATDFVELIEVDGSNNEETVRTRYCGDDSPAIYISSNNRLVLRYTTSIHNGGTGWVAIFMAKPPESPVQDSDYLSFSDIGDH